MSAQQLMLATSPLSVFFFFFFSAARVLLLAGVSLYAEYPWGDYVNVGLDPC